MGSVLFFLLFFSSLPILAQDTSTSTRDNASDQRLEEWENFQTQLEMSKRMLEEERAPERAKLWILIGSISLVVLLGLSALIWLKCKKGPESK